MNVCQFKLHIIYYMGIQFVQVVYLEIVNLEGVKSVLVSTLSGRIRGLPKGT